MSITPLQKKLMKKEEPKQDLEKEMFELEQELDIPSHLRWHNSKPKQETLEEAAERILNLSELDGFRDFHLRQELYTAFIVGIKYQQKRSYNEEEVKDIIAETWIRCVGSDGNNFKEVRDKILDNLKKQKKYE